MDTGLIALVDRGAPEPEPEELAVLPTSEPAVEESAPPWKFPRLYLRLALIAAFLILLAMLIPSLRNRLMRKVAAQPLTEQDTILIADFPIRLATVSSTRRSKKACLPIWNNRHSSTFLPDGVIHQQLRYMGKPTGTMLTSEIGREVCVRADSKAMLLGSIASLGHNYAITLKAVNCGDGRTLHVAQKEADQREHVLAKLHEAARDMRGYLGESLASIQKHDVPLFQDTTSSLEALEAFGVAMKTWRTKGNAAAVPLFKRAIEIDPNFAVAIVGLGVVYANLGQAATSAEYATRAYKLRDRVTEWERFSIDSAYYLNVTGEQVKSIQVNEQWRQLYPRALAPRINLAFSYANLGWIEKAWAEDAEAFKLTTNTSLVYGNLFSDYVALDRLQDAKALLEQARARKIDDPLWLSYYQLAFLQNDSNEMERIVNATLGTESESAILASHADTHAFQGRLSKAREFSRRAVDAALHADDREAAAGWLATEALREADFGNQDVARKEADLALGLASGKDVQVAAAMAFARAGERRRAQSILDSLQKTYPGNTLLTSYWIPTIRAAISLSRKDPRSAAEHLQAAAAYELGGGKPPFNAGATLYPAYLRGQAFLAMGKWNEAANEFRKVSSHRGLVWNCHLGALANLQLAYAYAGAGDDTSARKSFAAFSSLWRDADGDIGLLRQANTDLARLN